MLSEEQIVALMEVDQLLDFLSKNSLYTNQTLKALTHLREAFDGIYK